MKRMSCLRLAVAAFAGLYLQSCALDEYFESRVEQYTKAFIKEFGLVDPEQDWTMGRNANAEINVGATARSVKIYGKYGDTYYKVADLSNVGGQLSVPVHVPKTCTEMLVKVDGRSYYGKFGSSLNCTGVAGRGMPETTYTYDEEGHLNYNPVIFTKTVGNYTVKVKHTDTGNDPTDNSYQLFNTQQMAPIVSRDVWSDYYSLNTGEMTSSRNTTGILPESGIFNADRTYLDNVLSNANALSDVAVDFSVEAGDNGAFTLFPYYYGTNLIHELGIYLLNDQGQPLRDGADLIKLPIFVDKDPGDMQIQPHYCEEIKDIRVYRKDGKMVLWKDPIEINVGEDYDLDVRLYNKELGVDINNGQSYYRDAYKDYEITYDEAFMKKYHSRLAFHAWVDDKLDSKGNAVHERRFGTVFVSCDDFGRIMGQKDTHGYDDEDMKEGRYYMTASIATGLAKVNNMVIDGVAFDFPVVVTAPNKNPEPDPNPEPEPEVLKEKVFVPEGVAKSYGKTTDGAHKSTVVGSENYNFDKIVGVSEKWGISGCGVEADNYKYCLYKRDDAGNLVKDENGNLLLVDGMIEMLYKDIAESIDNNNYTFKGEWSSFEFSTEEYKLVGLNFLNENSNQYWLQLDIYVERREASSAPRMSRADIPADYKEMLTDNGKWRDVHRTWTRLLPYGKEVASYPVDMPMLARTRGYYVEITDSEGKPYKGKFGMYITVAQENKMAVEVDNNGGEKELDYVVTGSLAKPYTLYSQQNLNEFGQRSAAAFNHPTSGRTFFTFEDMNLTHKAADEGGYAYDPKEKSSDRDVNDLIFLLKGYDKIEGTKKITEKEEVNEEGFKWIWALEDLGSTGDFDFNDVVMQIGDITVTKTTQNAGGVEGNTTQEIVRELRFKPLAAGGTLPVHIHLKYKGQDYTLAPGEYDLTKGDAPEGAEWHKWFGNYQSSQMLNTGLSAHITTSDANTCVLIVNKDETVEDFLTGETYGDGATKQNVLYVVVQGDGDETFLGMQAVDQDRMSSEDAYMIPLPKKGFAAQSFFILGDDGGTWRWMQEYNHICLGYPDFAEWINNPTKEWTKKSDPNYLYNRGK